MVFTAVQNYLTGMSQIIPWYQEKAEIKTFQMNRNLWVLNCKGIDAPMRLLEMRLFFKSLEVVQSFYKVPKNGPSTGAPLRKF